VIVFDDDLTLVGSANLDSRSFRLNFEASCFIGSKNLNASLAEEFERDIERSKEVSLDDLDQLPWHAKLASSTAHLLSPLL
ncbi:MAG: phospholipase D-like domain-containing protein, partial [Polyangiaceae bacterium]